MEVEHALAKFSRNYRKLQAIPERTLKTIREKPELLKRVQQNFNHTEIYTIHYLVDGLLVMGYLVLPKHTTQPLPVVIYNRGGTEDFGLIKPDFLLSYLANIARKGYVVVGSQYPGNSFSQGNDERGGCYRYTQCY